MSQMKDFKFSDIIPLSLGTEVVGGFFSMIIPKNTAIPATRTKDYTTAYDYQTAVHCKLLEGERLMGADNHKLGEMKLTGIPPMRRHEPKIDVTFTIDANGTLHTKAVERSTGKSAEATVNYFQKRLNKQELDRMIEDAQKLRLEDKEKLETAKARNDLESYCLDLQDKAASNSAILNKCREVLDWLHMGKHSKQDYQMKKQELETFRQKHM